MNKQRLLYLFLSLAILLTVSACGSSLILENVDFSQPIESVLVPDSDQMVHDQRFAVKFSISPILTEENLTEIDEIRLIRNRAGFYFVTAAGFNNVYVFTPGESVLELVEKVFISENGLSQPAFNQRETYIELIDRNTGETFNLNY
tara:strand:+ start:53945 stop:54382 length:438 start_codon:yes stop_codon:yes gene_type:complete